MHADNGEAKARPSVIGVLISEVESAAIRIGVIFSSEVINVKESIVHTRHGFPT